MLFSFGQTVTTPGCLAKGINPSPLLLRHSQGDWGDVDDEDKKANDQAVKNGSRIFSAYRQNGHKVWVITEADRSSTCVLLPEEY
tara:strand:- start:18 stop:272 length:255 start_codon:yes stop_codon:yes gene_type:complete